jgi:hypothetical protein
MLFAKLLLLPLAVASSVTLYVSSVPVSDSTAVIPSPIPLAQIEYDVDQSVGTLSSYTPPTGSYASDHLLRVGLSDPKSGSWRGIVTSAASFADQYHKKFIIHVDERGEAYHVGFGTSAKGNGDEVEVEIVKRSPGPKPVLNKPIVLNAEGKLDSKEPEKTFLQKCVAPPVSTYAALKLIILQVLVGHCAVFGRSIGFWWRGFQIDACFRDGIHDLRLSINKDRWSLFLFLFLNDMIHIMAIARASSHSSGLPDERQNITITHGIAGWDRENTMKTSYIGYALL